MLAVKYINIHIAKAPHDQKIFASALTTEIAKQTAWANNEGSAMSSYVPFYSCGGVLPSASLLQTPVPGVHISMKGVEDVEKSTFNDGPPDGIMRPVCINVEAGRNPLDHRGALQILSPLEFAIAAVKA